MRTGERRLGRFVSLTPSELVVLDRGRNRDVIPLRQVRRIETVSHHARLGAFIGLVSGIGWALATCVADDNFCGDDASFPVLASILGGAGTGIGIGVGGIVNSATAGRHVLFEDRTEPVARIAPILGRRQAGIALSVRWK